MNATYSSVVDLLCMAKCEKTCFVEYVGEMYQQRSFRPPQIPADYTIDIEHDEVTKRGREIEKVNRTFYVIFFQYCKSEEFKKKLDEIKPFLKDMVILHPMTIFCYMEYNEKNVKF